MDGDGHCGLLSCAFFFIMIVNALCALDPPHSRAGVNGWGGGELALHAYYVGVNPLLSDLGV